MAENAERVVRDKRCGSLDQAAKQHTPSTKQDWKPQSLRVHEPSPRQKGEYIAEWAPEWDQAECYGIPTVCQLHVVVQRSPCVPKRSLEGDEQSVHCQDVPSRFVQPIPHWIPVYDPLCVWLLFARK